MIKAENSQCPEKIQHGHPAQHDYDLILGDTNLDVKEERRMNIVRPEAGDIARDFVAVDETGSRFALSDARKPGRNVMLLLYRGHW